MKGNKVVASVMIWLNNVLSYDISNSVQGNVTTYLLVLDLSGTLTPNQVAS